MYFYSLNITNMIIFCIGEKKKIELLILAYSIVLQFG